MREGTPLLSAVRLPHLGPGEVARFYFTTEAGDCRSKRSDAEVFVGFAPDAETTRERRAANSYFCNLTSYFCNAHIALPSPASSSPPDSGDQRVDDWL